RTCWTPTSSLVPGGRRSPRPTFCPRWWQRGVRWLSAPPSPAGWYAHVAAPAHRCPEARGDRGAGHAGRCGRGDPPVPHRPPVTALVRIGVPVGDPHGERGRFPAARVPVRPVPGRTTDRVGRHRVLRRADHVLDVQSGNPAAGPVPRPPTGRRQRGGAPG